MFRLVCLGLIGVAVCGCKRVEEGSREPDRPERVVPGPMPPEMARWMPEGAERAWQGSWVTRLGIDRMRPRDAAVALQIAGEEATLFDGKDARKATFAIIAPCLVELTSFGGRVERPPVQMTSMISKETEFAISGGAVVAGNGWVGYRRGKAAIACRSSAVGAVFTLEEGGECIRWTQRTRTADWQGSPAKCAWKDEGGTSRLVITDDGKAETAEQAPIVLDAIGDLLEDDLFQDAVTRKAHTRAESFAEAKAAVTAAR
jgi:hypothetical protein